MNCFSWLRRELTSDMQVWNSNRVIKAVFIGLLFASITVQADGAKRYTLDVQSQSIEQALRSLANAAGAQLLFPYDSMETPKAVSLRGRYTLKEALAMILKDTSLSGELTTEGVILITLDQKKNERGSEMNMKKNILSMVVGLFATGAMAQDVASDGSELDWLLEEVVVTATKRGVGTSIQDTAMAISAIGGDTIEKRGLVGMDDYLRTLPSVSFQDRGAGQNSIVIRGIASSPQTENEAIGVYFGETPVAGLSNAGNGGGGGNADIKMVDIARVEVLRGPQGTLYGSGSMGGTVRIIPKAPNLEVIEGSVSARYSNTGEKGGDNTMLQGVINIPLMEDQLAIRAVAYQFDNSGYIDNVASSNDPTVDALLGGSKAFGAIAGSRDDIGSDEYQGFRFSALWQPSDSLDLTLTYSKQEIEQKGWPEINQSLGEFQQARMQLREGKDEFLENDLDMLNLNVNYDLEWGSLSSSSSWIDYDQMSGFDLGFFQGVPIDAIGNKLVESFVQELRFSSSFDGPLQFLLGAYYEDRESSSIFDNDYSGAPELESTLIALFFPQPPRPAEIVNRNVLVNDIKQKAVFGELSYQITDQLEATVGGRYFEYDQDASTTDSGAFVNGFVATENDDSGSTFKFNVSYAPSEDILIYGQWAEGFRLGSPQTVLPASLCDADGNGLFELPDGSEIAVPNNVSPDELENFELGIKTSLANNRVTLNASIYRINWDGIPVDIGLACGGGVVLNAGESKSEGIEVESQISITESLRLDLSASYGESTLTKDAPGLGLGAVDGADLPGSADFNMSAGLEYNFTVLSTEAFVRADYSYIGEYFNNFEGDGQNAGDYHTVNVKAGLLFDAFNVDFFVKNLTNEDKFTWVESGFDEFGFKRAYQLRPRTTGLNISYQF